MELTAFGNAVKGLTSEKFEENNDVKNIVAVIFKKTVIGDFSDYKFEFSMTQANLSKYFVEVQRVKEDFVERQSEIVDTNLFMNLLTLRDRSLCERLLVNGVKFVIKAKQFVTAMKHLIDNKLEVCKLPVFLSF